ncbi:hypothetical protein BT67DRAFT_476935 [Trichocladium antarcticum]|uniref:Telomeric single stranded DNA binding POT1/Cdc13 domain-containing protein n=1 Tax=Trichocladium antarcticum TaxID=1450529 RepID=A0AAN6UVR9_9PEZI|nr:hypothetical protein BT67DRAFT_476935 [Trichocladium antarcticum]
MASIDGAGAALLASQPATPIAQLNPELPDQASRVVRGQVGITWPYNSVTKTAAFLLAEPDVRLRRANGQVRVELHGPSAQAAHECGIGAGDELLLSLDGVEWAKDVSPGRIPGSRVDWQLQFSQRLVLQVKSDETGEIKHVDIDHPADDQLAEPLGEARTAATPEPEPRAPDAQSAVRKIPDFPAGEYPSPAFVKRARLSYGALFEGGFDIFEEDGGVMGKGRKRTRFSRDSSAWRYASQSPSPEPASPVPDRMEEDIPQDKASQPSPKPQMLDEGCQTAEVEMAQAIPEPVEAVGPQREATSVSVGIPVPVAQERSATPTGQERVLVDQPEPVFTTPAPVKEVAPRDRETQVSSPQAMSGTQLREQPAQQQPPAEDQQPVLTPLTPLTSTEIPGALFGTPKSLSSSFSMFGASAPAGAESALSLSDQVRFGFSHIPQTTRSPVPPPTEPAPVSSHDTHEAYPISFLDDFSAPTQYAETSDPLNAADQHGEMLGHGPSAVPEPPLVETLGPGHWEMSTQSPHYNPIEGGHFGADALDEGTPAINGQASLHADAIGSGKVPEGFASYGPGDACNSHLESPPRQENPPEGQGLVENEEMVSGGEIGADEEKENYAADDELAYGERVEDGDYDRRNYEIPSDDEEGLSDQSNEIELEAEERYGNGEVYDEDGEEWDEEEEEYDEIEEDDYEEGYGIPGYQPAGLAPPKEPVVISLLSDSEDDDGPVPTPSKPPAGPKAAPMPDQPKPSSEEVATTARRAVPRGALESAQTYTTTPQVEQRQLPSSLFGQTHIVDFGARFYDGNSRQSGVSVAAMVASAVASSSANDAPAPFRVPGPRRHSHPPRSESAPSESSSEGLFVPQPRAKYLDFGDEPLRDGSSDGSERVGQEPSESDVEEDLGGQGDVELRDELMSVEEIEEDKDAIAQGSDDDLPDAEDRSFVSQVEISEMIEMIEEDAEDEDEDEDMDEAGVRSEVQDNVGAMQSGLGADGASDEDIDIIDAASALLEASRENVSLRGHHQDGTSVVLEIESEVVITTTVVSETLPSPRATPLEARIPAPTMRDGKLNAAGSVPETLGDVSSGGRDDHTVVPATPSQSQRTGERKSQAQPVAQQESMSTEQSSPSTKSDTGSLNLRAQQYPQEPSAQGPAEDVGAPSAEPQPEIEADMVTKVINNTSSAPSPDLDSTTKAQEDDLLPESSLPDELPTAVDMQEGPSGNELVVLLPTQADLEEELAAQEAEGLAQKTREPEMTEQPSPAEEGPDEDDEDDEEAMIYAQLSQEQGEPPEADTTQYLEAARAQAQPRTRSPSLDLSVNLARQAVGERRLKKGPQPARTSPPVTRARSSSLQTNATPERDLDSSVALARDALASPSRRAAADATTATTATTATLKSAFAKRLRDDLPAHVPLKTLRAHLDKHLDILAVVATAPRADPTRTARREYAMTVTVTDPSVAPAHVVEVQLYRPHRDALPVVAVGDVLLLRGFCVVALTRRGFGLRTAAESAWAVWEGGLNSGSGSGLGLVGGGSGEAGEMPPQIRGPPVEGWERCVGCVGVLRAWWAGLDGAARGRVERAGRKMVEAGGGGGGGK